MSSVEGPEVGSDARHQGVWRNSEPSVRRHTRPLLESDDTLHGDIRGCGCTLFIELWGIFAFPVRPNESV